MKIYISTLTPPTVAEQCRHNLLCVATSVHIFQLTFMSAVFLVTLAGSVEERSRVETV